MVCGMTGFQLTINTKPIPHILFSVAHLLSDAGMVQRLLHELDVWSFVGTMTTEKERWESKLLDSCATTSRSFQVIKDVGLKPSLH